MRGCSCWQQSACNFVGANGRPLTPSCYLCALKPDDPLFGLKGADAAVTFYTDILAPVTIVQTGSVVVRALLLLPSLRAVVHRHFTKG